METDPVQMRTDLEAIIARHDDLDQVAIKTARDEYHVCPPVQHSEALSFGKLQPTLEGKQMVEAQIDADDSLSAEQKVALKSELNERWRQQVVAQAGEGFND